MVELKEGILTVFYIEIYHYEILLSLRSIIIIITYYYHYIITIKKYHYYHIITRKELG